MGQRMFKMTTQPEINKNSELFTPSYDVTGREAQKLCIEYLNAIEAGLEPEERDLWPKYGCYLIPGSHPASNMARYIESTVKYNTTGITPEQLEEEYTDFEDSDFLIVIDHETRFPAAMLRMTEVNNSFLPSKTLLDIEKSTGVTAEQLLDELGAQDVGILDIGAFAVLDQYRGRNSDQIPASLLYRSLNHILFAKPGITRIIGYANEYVESSLKEYKIPYKFIVGDDANPSYYSDKKPSKDGRGIVIDTSEIFSVMSKWEDRLHEQSLEEFESAAQSGEDGLEILAIDQISESKQLSARARRIGAVVDPLSNGLDRYIDKKITGPSGIFYSRDYYVNFNLEAPDNEEAKLWARFREERLTNIALDFLENGPYGDIRDKVAGKQFATVVISASDPRFADLGKGPETRVFAKYFQRTHKAVYDEYAPHDPNSDFIVELDVSDIDNPFPAGAMRMIHGKTINDLKSIKDFIADDPSNPWRIELGEMLFDPDEKYSPEEAWKRLCEQNGVNLDPAESVDVATLSVFPKYGRRDRLNGVSIALYHGCYVFSEGKNLITIQDVVPFKRLQDHAQPFDTFNGVKPHPYGGPYDTIPAYSVPAESVPRVRRNSKFMGNLILDGMGISRDTMLLQELDPDTYGSKVKTTANFMIKASILEHAMKARRVIKRAKKKTKKTAAQHN
jgi:hypothetical protein